MNRRQRSEPLSNTFWIRILQRRFRTVGSRGHGREGVFLGMCEDRSSRRLTDLEQAPRLYFP